MAPNPSIALRERASRRLRERQAESNWASAGPAIAITTGLIALLLATALPWARQWLYSSCPVLSLLLIYGSTNSNRFIQHIPLWTSLTTLNLAYALTSTNRYSYLAFAVFCYTVALSTCFIVFSTASHILRSTVTACLRLFGLGDKIAFFNLPALVVDANTSGTFVVRGITISPFTLTVEAHGLELGLSLADDVDIAIYTDAVVLRLFHSFEFAEIFAVLRSGNRENETESSQAQHSSSSGNSSAGVERTSIKDDEADSHYKRIQRDLLDQSPLHQSHDKATSSGTHKERRAATCAKLQEVSFPHAERNIKISSLLDLFPEWLHRLLRQIFLRAPVVLRLALKLLGNMHDLNVASISTAGTGKRLTVLHKKIFGEHAQPDDEFKQLEQEVSQKLGDANICIELVDGHGYGHFPVSRSMDIITYASCADIIAYRTVPETESIETAMQLGGADTTFAIPLYLLPYHAHLLPSMPTEDEKQRQSRALDQAEGQPQEAQAWIEHTKLKHDVAEIAFSVHGTLPIHMDQSLLDLLAELGKEMGRTVKMEKSDSSRSESAETRSGSEHDSAHDDIDNDSEHKDGKRAKLRGKARDLRQNISQAVKQGAKKATLEQFVDDQWISKVVGKLAAQLERTQGDIGYLGEIPVDLVPYRRSAGGHRTLFA